MGKITKFIQEQIVDSSINKKYSVAMARVISYDTVTNMAKIGYTNPYGSGMIILDNVPVCLEPGGIKTSSIKNGDTVLITFISEVQAIVTRYMDPHYNLNTRERSKHKRGGSLLPDILCSR